MKKLNLQLGSAKEMLSKEQMKMIFGGEEDPGCSGNSWCGHTAGWTLYQCGLSEDSAEKWDYYCCSSC